MESLANASVKLVKSGRLLVCVSDQLKPLRLRFYPVLGEKVTCATVSLHLCILSYAHVPLGTLYQDGFGREALCNWHLAVGLI